MFYMIQLNVIEVKKKYLVKCVFTWSWQPNLLNILISKKNGYSNNKIQQYQILLSLVERSTYLSWEGVSVD